MTSEAVAVTAADSAAPVAAPVERVADRRIAGPSASGPLGGVATPTDPFRTSFNPERTGTVTLSPVVPAATRIGSPSMDLFGGADQPWRVQVGPRWDLGRKSGLMLRGGTEGQHNRWDLGASATIGDQSNVQGIVRFHP